jgi:ATP-dependent Lon protease
VEGYTRESGVRGLEAKIAQVIRNAAKSVAMEEEYNKKVTDEDIIRVLGVPRLERDKYESNDVAGVTGLAWTSVGGDILFIESLISPGKE